MPGWFFASGVIAIAVWLSRKPSPYTHTNSDFVGPENPYTYTNTGFYGPPRPNVASVQIGDLFYADKGETVQSGDTTVKFVNPGQPERY